MRIGDAREGLGRLPAGLVGNVDLLVSDVYSGAQTPAHLTTVEFYTEAARFLAPDGVLLVNVADGAGLAFARRQVATVRAVLEHVIVLAEVQTLKGRRFGNLVIAASPAPAADRVAAAAHGGGTASGEGRAGRRARRVRARRAGRDRRRRHAVAQARGIRLRALTRCSRRVAGDAATPGVPDPADAPTGAHWKGDRRAGERSHW